MTDANQEAHPGGSTRRRFTELMEPGRAEPPLCETALVVAREEYPDLNIRKYLARLHAFASVVGDRVSAVSGGRPIKELPADDRIAVINQYLFTELGFRGNRDAYDDPRNSYLNDVIDRRLGIPLTLSLVYIEVAAGAALRVVGVSFPGHFLVKTRRERPIRYLDPFNQGVEVTREQLRERLQEAGYTGMQLVSTLGGASNRSILRRLLTNLKQAYLKSGEYDRALAAVERLLVMNPDAADELRDLGVVWGGLGRYQEGIETLSEYLERVPGANDRSTVEQQIESFRYWNSRRN
jgi:regulator of sirC expression with transglutaminase-like and TPR domain